MARPRKQNATEAPASSSVDPGVIDALVGDRQTMAELDELFRQMKRAIYERALAGELTHHLGYPKGAERPDGQANHRNGTTPKTVLSEDGPVPLAIPRDRLGTFEPQLIAKHATHARRLPKFDEHGYRLRSRSMRTA